MKTRWKLFASVIQLWESQSKSLFIKALDVVIYFVMQLCCSLRIRDQAIFVVAYGRTVFYYEISRGGSALTVTPWLRLVWAIIWQWQWLVLSEITHHPVPTPSHILFLPTLPLRQSQTDPPARGVSSSRDPDLTSVTLSTVNQVNCHDCHCQQVLVSQISRWETHSVF